MATILRWIYSADTAQASAAVNRYADSVNHLSESMATGMATSEAFQKTLDKNNRLAAQSYSVHQRALKTITDAQKLLGDETGNTATKAEKARKAFTGWATTGFATAFKDAAKAASAANGPISTVTAWLGSLATSGPAGIAVLGGLAAGAVALLSELTPLAAALIPITIGFGGMIAAFKVLPSLQNAVKNGMSQLTAAFKQQALVAKPAILDAINQAFLALSQVMPALGPLMKAAGQATAYLFSQLNSWLTSSSGQAFIRWLETTGPKDIIHFAAVMWNTAHAIGDALDWIYRHSQAVNNSLANLPLVGPIFKLATTLVSKLGNSSASASKSIAATGHSAIIAAPKVQTLADAVANLNTQLANSINPNATFNTDLINVKQSAVDAANALKKSHDSIDLNTASGRAAATSTQGYVNQLITLTTDAGKNRQKQDEATGAIRRALPQLENVTGGTKAYWQEIKTLKSWLDKVIAERNVHKTVTVTGDGHWAVVRGPGGLTGGGRLSSGRPVAAGGIITGGTPGVDSVPIMAMPGEVVVPTHMVRAGAVDHLRGALPGFAQGGIVPSYTGPVGGLPPWGQANYNATVNAITAGVAQAMAAALKQAASAFGAPGGARHASIPWLQNLWISAGGPPSLAHLMAAIAMAESGGRANAYNSSGASGLWQILGAVDPRDQPFLFNPQVNAREAVLKWRTQGLGAWTTYTSGAYRAFYANGTPGAAPGWAWVGERGPELVHMHGGEQVIPHRASMAMTGAGYASGTAGLHHLTFASGHLWRDIHDFLKAINEHFNGAAQHRRDRIVERQADDMADIRQDIHKMQASMQAAQQYKASVKGNLLQYAGISSMTVGPGFYNGRQMTGAQVAKAQLSARLSQMRKFSSVLRRLAAMKLNVQLFRQIVDMGPDAGTAYAEQLLAGGPRLIKALSATQSEINREARNIGQGAANYAYGGQYRTAIGPSAFFGKHERHLERVFAHLGNILGREASKWLHVGRNAKHFAAGGWITEPVYGIGASGRSYTFGERGPERVVPGGGGGRPQVNIGPVHVHNDTDMGLLVQRLSFGITAASLGA